MKKVNKKIILLSFTLTFVLLFGGWFTYQYYGAEKPIHDKIAEFENVQLVQLVTDQKKATLTLKFEDRPDFGQDMLQIYEFLHDFKQDMDVHVSISLEQGENHPWWLEHSAEVTEAIHQKQYSVIPSILEEWEERGLITAGNVRMNQKHLFIYVKPVQDKEIYIYIPLTLE